MYAGVAGSPPAGRRIAREVQTAIELVMTVMNAQAIPSKLGCADNPQVSVGGSAEGAAKAGPRRDWHSPTQNARGILTGSILHTIPFHRRRSFVVLPLRNGRDSPRQKRPWSTKLVQV